MKKVYKDYLPLNANVTIDYSAEEKDRVRFDYPIKYSYKKAVWKGAYVAILGLWLYILLAIAYSGLIIYVLYKCILLIGTAQSVPIHISLASLITALLPLIIFGYVMFGIPAIITYYLSLDKKRLAKFVPKLSKYSTLIMGNIIERKFITKDIKDNKATILRFSNVYMDYNATGDFNKQLQHTSDTISVEYYP